MFYDYYKILDIPRDASLDDIKRAYRNKAKQIHPDINSSPKANEVFIIVNEAYETLTDERKRYMHDLKLDFAESKKVEAEKKKQYYGSSVKNDTFTNTKASDIKFDWKSASREGYKEKTDEDYFKQAPVIYNLFFASGMFVGFLIVIVTLAGTFKNLWPSPFVLITIIGIILIWEGWKGIMGKRTLFNGIWKWFKKIKNKWNADNADEYDDH